MAAFVLLSGCLLSGCYGSHGASGPATRSDTGPPGSTFDGGRWTSPLDAGRLPDSGTWWPGDAGTATPGSGDAGYRLPPDTGPTGDRAGEIWEGYVESYAVPGSGSDRVRIVFDSASGDGPRTGIVVFGTGPAPAPVSDPSVGYPPGESMPGGGPWEGFEYPIVSGSVIGSRVLVTVDLYSFWAVWCAYQPPVPVDVGGISYACIPNVGLAIGPDGCFLLPEGSAPIPIDCGRMFLCGLFGGRCACTASACGAAHGPVVTFDFHVVGSNGDGTVDLSGLHNVRLVRTR